jgi:hypothetical protein
MRGVRPNGSEASKIATEFGASPLDQPSHLARIAEIGAVEQHVDAVRFFQLPAVGLDLVGMAEAVQHDVQPSDASRVRWRARCLASSR